MGDRTSGVRLIVAAVVFGVASYATLLAENWIVRAALLEKGYAATPAQQANQWATVSIDLVFVAALLGIAYLIVAVVMRHRLLALPVPRMEWGAGVAGVVATTMMQPVAALTTAVFGESTSSIPDLLVAAIATTLAMLLVLYISGESEPQEIRGR